MRHLTKTTDKSDLGFRTTEDCFCRVATFDFENEKASGSGEEERRREEQVSESGGEGRRRPKLQPPSRLLLLLLSSKLVLGSARDKAAFRLSHSLSSPLLSPTETHKQPSSSLFVVSCEAGRGQRGPRRALCDRRRPLPGNNQVCGVCCGGQTIGGGFLRFWFRTTASVLGEG